MMNKVNEEPMARNSNRAADAGVHERTYLQETPAGDFIILTFEGENPARLW